jgi:hypothetical protein
MKATDTPCERTIESLSNHGFLEVLNWGKAAPPYAWFYLPTQNDEALLGYDAELVGFKRLFIQYKRMGKGGNFKFDFRQLWTLCSRLPQHTKPYVFLSGNLTADYPMLATHHGFPNGGRFNAFNETFFVDAWSVVGLLCEAVYGALLLAFPAALPSPPPTNISPKELGTVTLKPAAGPVAFTISLQTSAKLWHSVIAVLWAMNYHGPFLPTAPFAFLVVMSEGVGAQFALDTAQCLFGKPTPEEPRDTRVIHEQGSDVGRLTVLTVPMP